MDSQKRAELNAASEERGISSNAYLLEALDLRLSFSGELWRIFETLAESTGIKVEHLIVNSLLDHFSHQKAYLDVFGRLPPKWNRFVKWAPDGKLILRGELWNLLYEEHKMVLDEFKNRLRDSVENEKPFEMTPEELSEMSRGGEFWNREQSNRRNQQPS